MRCATSAIDRLKTIRRLVLSQDRTRRVAERGKFSSIGCLGAIVTAAIFLALAIVAAALVERIASPRIQQIFGFVFLVGAFTAGSLVYVRLRRRTGRRAAAEVPEVEASLADAISRFGRGYDDIFSHYFDSDHNKLKEVPLLTAAISGLRPHAEAQQRERKAERRREAQERRMRTAAAPPDKRRRPRQRRCPECGKVMRYGTNNHWPSCSVWWCSLTSSDPGCGYEINPTTHPEKFPDYFAHLDPRDDQFG